MELMLISGGQRSYGFGGEAPFFILLILAFIAVIAWRLLRLSVWSQRNLLFRLLFTCLEKKEKYLTSEAASPLR